MQLRDVAESKRVSAHVSRRVAEEEGGGEGGPWEVFEVVVVSEQCWPAVQVRPAGAALTAAAACATVSVADAAAHALTMFVAAPPQDEAAALHPHAQQYLDRFAQEYARTNAPMKLVRRMAPTRALPSQPHAACAQEWQGTAGAVEVEVEVAGQQRVLHVSPLAASALLHFSDTRASAAAHLVAHALTPPPCVLRCPSAEWAADALAAEMRADPGALQRKLAPLVAEGVLEERRGDDGARWYAVPARLQARAAGGGGGGAAEAEEEAVAAAARARDEQRRVRVRPRAGLPTPPLTSRRGCRRLWATWWRVC